MASAYAALEWLIQNVADIEKITAHCPSKYLNVYAFLKKFGFVDEGLNRAAWRVDNKIYDIHLLGLVKNEFMNILKKGKE